MTKEFTCLLPQTEFFRHNMRSWKWRRVRNHSKEKKNTERTGAPAHYDERIQFEAEDPGAPAPVHGAPAPVHGAPAPPYGAPAPCDSGK